jgi:hypothetical protein
MSAEIMMFGGFVDGEQTLDTSSGDYVAGQPVEISANGVKVSSTDANYAGIMKNDKSIDAEGGPQVGDTPVSSSTIPQSLAVIWGTNKVRMNTGTRLDGTTDQPYVWPATAHAWTEGDEVFNNASGKWDNVTASGSVARGRVVGAPAEQGDDLIVYFYK